MIRSLFPLVFCFDTYTKWIHSKILNLVKYFKMAILERERHRKSVWNGANCWNFIHPFWTKFHFLTRLLPTDPISKHFQSAWCNQTPFLVAFFYFIHFFICFGLFFPRSFRWTTILFKFFWKTLHSDGVKRTGTFRKFTREINAHANI